MTNRRVGVVLALLFLSMGLTWSEWTSASRTNRISTWYGPQCIPSGMFSTCDFVPQMSVTPETETTRGTMRGTDSTARFAVAVISVFVVWKRKQWTRRYARNVLVGGALFVLWQSGGNAMQPGVITFVGALIALWLGRTGVGYLASAERSSSTSAA